MRAPERRTQGVHGRRRLEPIDQDRARPLRRGQDLDRHLVHERERAVGACEQLADIVAGHVLDHAAAGLEALAPPAHRVHAEEVIARCPRLDPTRAREIAGERTAQSGAFGRAEQRRIVRRLERKHLPFGPDCAFDRSERRCRLGRQHQLGGLVVDDAVERGERKGGRALHRPAKVPL